MNCSRAMIQVKCHLITVFCFFLEICAKRLEMEEIRKEKMLKLRLNDVSCSFCFVTLLGCRQAWLPYTVPGPCCSFWVKNMDIT